MKKIFIIFIFSLPLISLSSTFVSFPTKIDTIQERINIQVVLNRVMVPSPGLVVDGVLGKKSIQAVQAFQESRGLVVDGKIGPITRLALENAQTGGSTITTYTNTTTITTTGCSSGALYNTQTGQPCTTNQSHSSGCEGNNKYNTLTGELCNTLIPTTSCSGSAYSSCSISNGQGIKSRTCNSGIWSPYGTCILTSCNNGYQVINNTCIVTTCSGSSTQSCTITNGTGIQSRTCNEGTWSSYGTCSLTSCNSGYTQSGNTCVVIIVPDTTKPTITSFTIPSISSSLSVPISSFTATDNTGVTGYLLNESSSTPNASSGSWTTSPSSIYTFISEGLKTLYAWAKDNAGNISNSLSRSTTITLPLPVCTPEPTSTTCLNKCGSQINNCGNSVSCGGCGGDENFTVYNSWNFEGEDLGQYIDSKIAQDFNYTILYSHNSANIINDVINNTSTKVMKITHPANVVSDGFEMNVNLGRDYDELYLSYNWKFSNEFDSTAGGKMSGLGGLPDFTHPYPDACPVDEDGFRVHNIFYQAGQIFSYHYDRTPITYHSGQSGCPWGGPAGPSDYWAPMYFSNGTWYNITQRLVMNTFTNGVANSDGIKEMWVDGRMISQERNLKFMETDRSDMKIDAFRLANFYGGGVECAPLNESYGYIDNIKVYMPTSDSISGHQFHSISTILSSPDTITDRNVYYDNLITSPGTLSNSEYGHNYSPENDETYLIDAGAGHTVTYTINGGYIGGGDFLLIYGGNRSDSSLLKVVEGARTPSGTFTSSGRYMFIRFSTDKDAGTTGWTGTVSFN